MIYAILWMESLSVCVLGVLSGFACWQQFTRIRSIGRAAMVLPVLFALLFCTAQLVMSYILYSHGMPTNYLFYSVSFATVLVMILSVLLYRGFRKDGEERRIASWPLARLGIAFAASVALYFTTLMTTDTTVQTKLANVRLEAGALAMSEAPPRPVERENAALIYAQAFERMSALKTDPKKDPMQSFMSPPKWSDPAMDASNPEVKAYLVKMKSALDLIRRAAAMPSCAFDRAFATPSLDIPLPELGKMRECARLLALDARSRAADGDIKGALEDVRAINGISEHLGYEPILISGLVSMACYHIGSETLEGILRTTEPSAADIDAAWSNDNGLAFRRVYKRCMRGERAVGLSAFTMFGDSGGAEAFNALNMAGSQDASPAFSVMAAVALPYWRVYLLQSDLRSYNETMKTMEQSASYSYKQGKATLAPLKDPNVRRDGILTSMLAPALSRFFDQYIQSEARVRLATLARAVCMYRAKNNAYPKDLDALMPAYLSDIPLDPFDDKPLRMKSSAAGVTLYSIGSNETDDGGQTSAKNEENTGDILLRIGKVDSTAPVAPTGLDPSKPKPALPSPPKTGF